MAWFWWGCGNALIGAVSSSFVFKTGKAFGKKTITGNMRRKKTSIKPFLHENERGRQKPMERFSVKDN